MDVTVALVGNPNCGKTTLFNGLTGANMKVANWPGVTVEKKEGRLEHHGQQIHLLDLPGIYSLNTYTLEEKITKEYLLQSDVDLIVNVVDGTSLDRHLYLTLQLLELGKPMMLIINMMDIVERRGTTIDIEQLSRILGIPVIPVCGRKKEGLEEILLLISQVDTHGEWYHEKSKLRRKVIQKENEVVDRFQSVDEILLRVRNERYSKWKYTDRIDSILLFPWLGLPVFLFIMAIIFYMTFWFGNEIKLYFQEGLYVILRGTAWILKLFQVHPHVISLLVDGVLTGVFGVLIFLPNLMILFVMMGLLEDSGYMARVAYLMDGIMEKIGLSGKAFLPMILGFGCSVPAILASRSLERMEDRRRTILIIPFMSCSARLPIYLLFSQIFFTQRAMIVAYSMYLLGILVAIGTAYLMEKGVTKKEVTPLLIELPDYHRPCILTLVYYTWEKLKDYLLKAGTTIFAASTILWLILHTGPSGIINDMSLSFAAMLGRSLEPLFQLAGLGQWQMIVSLISGVAAKEMVVSSFSILYGISNISSLQGKDILEGYLIESGFGPLSAISFMVFSLLYLPCVATLTVAAKEMRSFKWTVFAFIYPMLVAFFATIVIYQVGSVVL